MKQVKGIWFPDSDFHFESMIDSEGNYQEKQFKTALKYIKPEDRGLFIDVGAHVGLWSVMAMKNGFTKFICFEPDKDNFDCLHKNLSDHKALLKITDPKIFLCNFALSDKVGTADITLDKEDNSGAKYLKDGNSVNTDVFDEEFAYSNFYKDFLPGTFSNKVLIKIDVQGYEAKVVRGMTNFIKEYKPIIIVEQWLNGKEDLEATHYLESLGMKTLERVKKEIILGW